LNEKVYYYIFIWTCFIHLIPLYFPPCLLSLFDWWLIGSILTWWEFLTGSSSSYKLLHHSQCFLSVLLQMSFRFGNVTTNWPHFFVYRHLLFEKFNETSKCGSIVAWFLNFIWLETPQNVPTWPCVSYYNCRTIWSIKSCKPLSG